MPALAIIENIKGIATESQSMPWPSRLSSEKDGKAPEGARLFRGRGGHKEVAGEASLHFDHRVVGGQRFADRPRSLPLGRTNDARTSLRDLAERAMSRGGRRADDEQGQRECEQQANAKNDVRAARFFSWR